MARSEGRSLHAQFVLFQVFLENTPKTKTVSASFSVFLCSPRGMCPWFVFAWWSPRGTTRTHRMPKNSGSRLAAAPSWASGVKNWDDSQLHGIRSSCRPFCKNRLGTRIEKPKLHVLHQSQSISGRLRGNHRFPFLTLITHRKSQNNQTGTLSRNSRGLSA